jgi:CubicO group peptidase (beta-lactamase class C family)
MSTTDWTNELRDVVEAAMARLHVPGVAIGVLHEGREETACLGVTSAEQPLPVDAATLFQIGSITKTFLATLVARLVEAGRLDLHRPVRDYLPDLRLGDPAATAETTMTHLLTHTGGWEGDEFADTGMGDDALTRYVAGMAELPQLTPPGAIFNYNNAGFSLAGRVVEAVTGQSFEAAMREWLLGPLGMRQAAFFADEVITERFAVGHIVRDEGATVARPWALARSAHPAGGLAANVHDLFRYARFHLGDGTVADGVRLLRTDTLQDMRAARVAITTTGGAVGLAWMLRTADGVGIVQHGGATNGQNTSFLLAPERDFALIVLTNSDRGRFLCEEVNTWALRRLLGLATPEPALTTLPAGALAAYAGRYTKRLSDIEITVRDGEAVLRVIPKGGFPKSDSPPPPAPPPARLGFYDPDHAVVLDTFQRGTRLEFLRDEAGRIVWLRSGVRLFARQP